MAGFSNLTQVPNPIAQTVRISEPGGVVLTAVSLYFESKPGVSDPQLPITLELREVTNGIPSSTKIIPGSRVVKNVGDVNVFAETSVISGFALSSAETKFEFEYPVFIPSPSEIAIVAYTNAAAGQYKLWHAELGDYRYIDGETSKSTTSKITVQPAVGVLLQSANGTTWTPKQDLDLAFKIYKAKFTYENTYAVFEADVPPLKTLSYNDTVTNPFIFTASSDQVRVLDPGHGYLPGQTVTLSLKPSGTYSTTAGIAQADLEGKRVIAAADAWGYTITADATATDSAAAGGQDWLVSQQYKFNIMQVQAPVLKPAGTDYYITGEFTEFADVTDPTAVLTDNTVFASSGKLNINNYEVHGFKHPFAVVDSAQEILRLSGNASTKITISLNTLNENVSPAIDVSAMSATVTSPFIDYQDSDDAASITGHNKASTIEYVPESHPFLGSAATKHVTVPFNLAASNAATSIRVLVDAVRPPYSDFDVWYRTWNREDKVETEVEWSLFSKTSEGPNISNYEDTPNSFGFSEYEFSVFDLPVFDTYQIKIVMKAGNSSNSPMFKNLRTIATI